MAGVLAVVEGGVGSPLQCGQVAGAGRVRGRCADRCGDVHYLAVVQDDRGTQRADQLREALVAAVGGQLEDGGELIAPSRPIAARAPAQAVSRVAIAARTASSAPCPSVSLTALKWLFRTKRRRPESRGRSRRAVRILRAVTPTYVLDGRQIRTL